MTTDLTIDLNALVVNIPFAPKMFVCKAPRFTQIVQPACNNIQGNNGHGFNSFTYLTARDASDDYRDDITKLYLFTIIYTLSSISFSQLLFYMRILNMLTWMVMKLRLDNKRFISISPPTVHYVSRICSYLQTHLLYNPNQLNS